MREREIQQHRRFDGVLKDKGIKGYLDMMDEHMVKTRVMMGFGLKASDKNNDNIESNSSGKQANSLGQGWAPIFGIMVTSKSQLEEEQDDQLLSVSDIPPWMDMDTLYVFKHSGPGDSTDFIYKVEGRQMLMIEYSNDPRLKGEFNIVIESKELIYYLGTKFATEAAMWVQAFRRAKKSGEELTRVKDGKITVNIDLYVDLFRKKVKSGLSHWVERRRASESVRHGHGPVR
jgi:hypothetical protein